jgi:hypothetical protein
MENPLGDWTGSFDKTTGDDGGIATRRRILSDGFIAALLDVTRRASSRGYRHTHSVDGRGENA